MRNNIIFLGLVSLFISCSTQKQEIFKITKEDMKDKVAGAWAAKMIGVMYGRSMEFKAVGKTFEDSIPWYPSLVENSLLEDDIYGQLSLMSSLEKYGDKATVQLLAKDFANASFPLCHANLQARKNIFEGLTPPQTGHPEYSMHADDIDFQIESDFIGFIHPTMTKASNAMADSVGRIMAYGDGLYGGMFVSAMHTIAYKETDITKIVKEALKAIPTRSTYAQCLQDVVLLFEKDPTDWKKAWSFIENKWAKDDICVPYHDFNIDAKLNGAYIVIGLLYGQGDFQKTMEIAIRCGQDTDCNSANAAAVLGIIKGYNGIPEDFKSHIPIISDKNFLHTESSYNKAIEQTLRFIEKNVLLHGGKVTNDEFHIKIQQPAFEGQLEQSYPNKVLSHQIQIKDLTSWKLAGNWQSFVYGDGDNDPYQVANSPGDSLYLEFEGTGISLLGSWNKDAGMADVYLDGKFIKRIDTYFREEAGKYDVNRAHLFHKMDLTPGKHHLKLVVAKEKNSASSAHRIYVERAVIYKNK